MHAFRVLIVDDQSEVRRVLRSGLESLGPRYKVIDVPSGEEAMLVFSRQEIDLAVLDVRLAGISGLEFYRKLKKRRPDTKVIIITGLTEQEVHEQVIQAGADAFFFKPIDMSAFLAAVQRLLTGETEAFHQATLPLVGPEFGPGLLDRLDGLRQESGATWAAVIDRQGQAQAASGKAVDQKVVMAIAAVLESGRQANAALGAELPEACFCFGGKKLDVLAVRLSETAALVLAFSPRSDPQNWPSRVACALAASDAITASAAPKPAPQPAAESLPAPSGTASQPAGKADQEDALDESIAELERMFEQAAGLRLEPKDVDAFWETATDEGEEAAAQGALTYDQARRLGLDLDQDGQA